MIFDSIKLNNQSTIFAKNVGDYIIALGLTILNAGHLLALINGRDPGKPINREILIMKRIVELGSGNMGSRGYITNER